MRAAFAGLVPPRRGPGSPGAPPRGGTLLPPEPRGASAGWALSVGIFLKRIRKELKPVGGSHRK